MCPLKGCNHLRLTLSFDTLSLNNCSHKTLNYSENVSSCVGSTGAVRIAASSKLGTIPGSSYDVVCIVDPVVATSIDLAAILRILRPDGILWILQLTVQSDATSKLAVDIISQCSFLH